MRATAAYSNENPFASTHSLDANPFDDPEAQQEAERQARLQELSARERDLERREAELKLIRRTKYIELVNNLTKYVSMIIYCRVGVACRTDRAS